MFDETTRQGNLLSVRECQFELKGKFSDEPIDALKELNKDFFTHPTLSELEFIAKMYSIRRFQQHLEAKKLLQGGYFADPFIIARAKILGGTVVTEEKHKPNAVKIPNICEHYKIECVCMQGFLSKEDWTF
jgi:hypothetical protein